MDLVLTVSTRVFREKFTIEKFLGSDDIFALVKDGSFFVKGDGEEYTVRRGEGFLFRKNVLYTRRVIEPVTMYLFRYKGERRAFDREHILFKDRNRIASTLSMLDLLDGGILENDFAARANLFADVLTQYAIENRLQRAIDPVIEAATDEIRRYFHTDLDLTAVAESTGLSYVQFLRRFKKYSGMTPSDYLYALKIQKAKSLLADTDLLIKDVAAACGFDNEYYFSNFFKKHVRMSPSVFRSKIRV